MVFCTYCGQSFTRDEHLERHILTHTNVKPFKCNTCHMSFARRDLLQRHYLVHGRNANSSENTIISSKFLAKSAGRTPIACNNCAKTKTKCDKKFPCSRCAGRNLKCTARPTRRVSKSTIKQSAAEAFNNDHSAMQDAGRTECGTKQSPREHWPQPLTMKEGNVTIKSGNEGLWIHQSDEPATFDSFSSVGFALDSSLGGLAASPFEEQPSSAFHHFPGDDGFFDFANSLQYPMDGENVLMEDYSSDPANLGLGTDMTALIAPGGGLLIQEGDIEMMDLVSMHSANRIPMVSHHVASSSETSPSTSSSGGAEIGMSGNDIMDDIEAVTIAQKSWNVFRCSTQVPSEHCPQTARLHLERLEQCLRGQDSGDNWSVGGEKREEHEISKPSLSVSSLSERTREKLLAIAQTFLHKALEIHSNEPLGSSTQDSFRPSNGSNMVLLPPNTVLQHFLRMYATTFERFFPLTASASLDPNDMIHRSNEKPGSLLLLLMIAQGAVTTPNCQGRLLSGGLIETCRISLFDLIEKNIKMSTDLTVLRAALLLTVQAAWSGDKWHMDIAMGQRGMYFAMLRHSGNMDPSTFADPDAVECGLKGQARGTMAERDDSSRLIYSWMMVDQDLSLFHDIAPLFSVTEFGAPMPEEGQFWQARELSADIAVSSANLDSDVSTPSIARARSIRELFKMFLEDGPELQSAQLTSFQLRLLLHPIQTLISQYRQLASCMAGEGKSGLQTSTTSASADTRSKEARQLLERWRGLTLQLGESITRSPVIQAGLILYHLLSLNIIVDFPAVEKMARRYSARSPPDRHMLQRACMAGGDDEAMFHCGQVLRIIRTSSSEDLAPWWAAAIYRATIVLWICSRRRKDIVPAAKPGVGDREKAVALDALPVESSSPEIVFEIAEAGPLTMSESSQVPITNTRAMLLLCIGILDGKRATRFSEGIRNKLKDLASR